MGELKGKKMRERNGDFSLEKGLGRRELQENGGDGAC